MQKFNLIKQTRMWRTRRKWMILIGLYLFAVDYAQAQDCTSTTFDFSRTTVVQQEISILDVAKEIASHDVQNVQSVQVSAVDGAALYISATYVDGKLTFSTTESFRDYASKETSRTLLSQLVFTCTSGTRNIRYQVPLKEENLYTPTFGRQEYKIVLPLPLPRAFDLMQYIDGGKGVVANDNDLTKNKITFALTANEYFEVDSVASATQKEFIARLRTKATLTRIEQGLTIGISGTDEGDPPKTGNAVLKFSGDPTVIYTEPPQFQTSLYKATYKRDTQFTPIEVQLKATTFDNSVTFQLSGEDEQWFAVTPKDDRSGASVTLRPGVAIPESKQFASAIVTASRLNAAMDGKTAIVVEFEPVVKLVPAFEETIYGGEIGQDRAVKLSKAIKLVTETVVGEVQLVLSGDDGRFFTASSGVNGIQLTATAALTEEMLKEQIYFHFVIEAKNAGVDQAGHAYVVLDVVKDEVVPKFDQLYYEGSVTEEGIMALGVPIPESLQKSTISYAGDIELFSIDKQADRIIFTTKDITEEKLIGKSYLLVKVSAANDEVIVAETIVIVKIIRLTIVTPKFASNLLQGQLNEMTNSLSEIKVTVTPDTYKGDTSVTLVDNLFELKATANPNEFTIALKNGVAVPSQSHFSLVVEATNPKSATARCFILIEVNRIPVPQFEQLLYEGLIDSSNVLQELKLKLTSDTYDDSIVFTLVGNEAELFKITRLPSNELQINLADPEMDVANRNNLRFNVRATRGDLVATVPVVVFIQKAEVKLPKFEKPLYKSTIGTDLQLVPFEAIRLVSGTEAEGLEVQIHLNNSDFFKVELAGIDLSVALKEPLIPTDIEGYERFEFVVEVENPGVGSGFATIVVDIKREVIVIPEFTAASYGGTMNEGSKDIALGTTVTLKDGTAAAAVIYAVTGEDAGLVNHQIQEDGSLKFFLKDDVTVDQVKVKTQLNFVIQATNPGSPTALAAIVVNIIRPVPVVFTKNSFTGVLKEGVTTADLSTDTIEIVQDTLLEGVSLALTGSNSNLLEVSLTADKIIQISLRTTTNWNQIRFLPYLTFSLQATNPGAPTSSCTIILNVENRDVPTPRFTKTFYRGSLQPNREVTFTATDVITLQPDTITATLAFRVVENDYDLFQVTREVDKFKVVLKDTVTEDAIKDRDLFSFVIEANNEFGATDSTVVLCSALVEEIITPVFGAAIYSGSIKEGSSEVQIGDIAFVTGTAGNNIAVGADQGDSSWFDVKIEESKVVIAIRTGVTIPWDTIEDREFLKFRIQATNPGSDPATAFVVLDIVRTEVVAPKFKSATFQGSLVVGTSEVQFPAGGLIEFEAGSLLPGYVLLLVDNDHEMFEAKVNGDQVKITLTESVKEDDLKDKNYLRFSVAVSNPGSLTVKANVIIDLKRDPEVTPLFEKLNYKGAIGTDLRLNLAEPIRISEATYTTDVVTTVIESSSNLLHITQNQREVIVELSNEISSEDLKGLRNLHLTIQAKGSNQLSSVCFLLVSLPDDGTCIDTKPPIVDCTECRDCTTGQPQDDVPVFHYGNYRFFLKSDQTGMVGIVKASTKNPSITLEHQSNIEDEYLRARLSFSTDGILQIQQSLDPANYQFQVTALNAQAGKQSTVDVLLDVTQDLECPVEPGSPKNPTVERSLVIQSLQEEFPHPNIFPSQLGECEYELIGERPLLDQGYFSIDPTTHWLTARAFDRENTQLFGDMLVPQFQLRLRLACPGQAIRSKRSLIETDDLNYARDVTVLNVIVEDVNDNSPSFEYPAAQGLHFGFPTPTIAAGLMLPELITVVAKDVDEGLNAKVRYSIDENEDFGIDAESGQIYPLKNAMKASQLVKLVVQATDRDGASDGRRASMEISVHRLEEDNMVMLSIPGGVDAAELIDQVNNNADRVRVQTLVQALVPSVEKQGDSRARASAEDSTRRLVVYAFNGNNELQDSDTIQRIIQSSTLPVAVTTDTFSSGCLGSPSAQCGEDSNFVGLIVAASVLGALFLISAGIAVFLYIRFVRPLNTASANPSDVVQLENDFDISPPPSPPTIGAKKIDDSPQEDRRISIQISGITDQESEDSRFPTGRLADSLNAKLDSVDEYGSVSSRVKLEEPPSTESRNVKFNELVERIEVVEHLPGGGGEDNDSSYNERF
uniref:Cadherin domain-containing protein n=1 Tax=Culex tarsalis TaxID=7177 RepID=A0A1Q3FJC5_CULTA